MTQANILGYTEAVRWRYLRSSKTEKSKILDEFTKVTSTPAEPGGLNHDLDYRMNSLSSGENPRLVV